ncbi:MAG: putative collagen-binding domain-containing protein [Pseudomonadota bacterium]
MSSSGMLIHALTQETENDQLLNNGALGLERKLYYRELISRFAHHPALHWNLGEENTNTTAQLIEYSDFIKDLDPYQHPVLVHSLPSDSDREQLYAPLLGALDVDGAAMQTSQINSSGDMYDEVRDWIDRSTQSGHPWVVTLSEASGSTAPAPFTNVSANQRIYWMWASAMAGGSGFEWYLRGQNQGHDLDLAIEDMRGLDQHWQQTGHLVRFFRDIVQANGNVALENMVVDNSAVNGNTDWVLSNVGSAYIVFLRSGGNLTLNLVSGTNYDLLWFNPRTGASFDGGLVGSSAQLGAPPEQTSQDWVALLTASTDNLPSNDMHPDIVRVLNIPLSEIVRTPGNNWWDSYSVGDECFCQTTFDHNIGPIVVDTSIGSMTVFEACALIGPGPGSQGRPVYNDVQCGNGPANDAGDEDYCPGRTDITGGTTNERRLGCNQVGPTWKFQ